MFRTRSATEHCKLYHCCRCVHAQQIDAVPRLEGRQIKHDDDRNRRRRRHRFIGLVPAGRGAEFIALINRIGGKRRRRRCKRVHKH